MKERVTNSIGLVKKQAEYISFEYEEKLWSQNVLREDTPDKCRNTVLFLLGMNLALRAGDENYDLRRNCQMKPSQLSFRKNSEGVKCLVYTEDITTKTNDGGLRSMGKECKVVWVYPSKNTICDPVCLVEKYISLCPPVIVKTKKLNFYLRSLEKCTLNQWYGEQVVGPNSIRKVVGDLLKSVNLDGHFTNHSLRCTVTSRLFQSGMDKKLIKEFTGHHSDALDQYEVTSELQRKEMSKVIGGESLENDELEGFDKCEPSPSKLHIAVTNNSKVGCMGCSCNRNDVKVSDSDKIGDMIK